jgi:SAM-dependent methyltransferase
MICKSDDVFTRHLARVPVHRALIRALEHQLFCQEEAAHPLLDIGCGDGYFASLVFPEGIDCGVDVGLSIVAEARANASYRYLAAADGCRLPFPDESFQSVVSNCVIEHIADIDAVVQEVARVLKPQGRFVFSVPNHLFSEQLFTSSLLRKAGMLGLAHRFETWWNRNAAHKHLDSPEVWQERLARYGLAIRRQAYYMSPAATKAFELAHYYAVPSALVHAFVGRWSLFPGRAHASLAYRWLERYAREQPPSIGSCNFYVAYKLSA